MPARVDPYRGFRFRVEIDRIQQAGFQSVTGLERQCKIETYREGGVNDFEHQLVTLTTYPSIAMKRGLVDKSLWDWHQDVINGVVDREVITILLLDESGEEAWRWVCIDAFPSKWTGSELDAHSNTIATETVEFVHQGLLRQ